MSFYERYAQCCQQKGISPVSQFAADAIGCTKSTISTFAKTGATPRGEIVAGAAKMLDVSADYLLGLCEDPHPISLKLELTQSEKTALLLLNNLNDAGFNAALAVLAGLEAQEIYKKDAAASRLQKNA